MQRPLPHSTIFLVACANISRLSSTGGMMNHQQQQAGGRHEDLLRARRQAAQGRRERRALLALPSLRLAAPSACARMAARRRRCSYHLFYHHAFCDLQQRATRRFARAARTRSIALPRTHYLIITYAHILLYNINKNLKTKTT